MRSAVIALLFFIPMDSMSEEEYCRYTCQVLDMDYSGVVNCWCLCKDVDGTQYEEAIPECP